jgi:hypothetical protein
MKYLLFLIVIMITQIDLSAQSNFRKKRHKYSELFSTELIISHPLTGDRIEVASEDIEGEMNWFQAVRACSNLGQGWRLPTIEELKVIYSDIYLKGKGNFLKDRIYWSSTEIDNELAWIFYMDIGKAFDIWVTSRKGNTSSVRPVRTL